MHPIKEVTLACQVIVCIRKLHYFNNVLAPAADDGRKPCQRLSNTTSKMFNWLLVDP